MILMELHYPIILLWKIWVYCIIFWILRLFFLSKIIFCLSPSVLLTYLRMLDLLTTWLLIFFLRQVYGYEGVVIDKKQLLELFISYQGYNVLVHGVPIGYLTILIFCITQTTILLSLPFLLSHLVCCFHGLLIYKCAILDYMPLFTHNLPTKVD